MTDIASLPLGSLRDLLLPGIYMTGSNVEMDIYFNFEDDCLILKAFNKKSKNVYSKIVSRGDIELKKFAKIRDDLLKKAST